MTVTIEPIFNIRGLKHQDIFDEYCAGKFQTAKLHNADTRLMSCDSEDEDAGKIVNQLITKSNRPMTILMSEKVVCRDVNGKPLQPGRCDWCRDIIQGAPIGIPVKSRYDVVEKITHYTCVKKAGHFECAARLLDRFGKTGIFLNSSQLLNTMFDTCYPGEKLELADDDSLHENWGGPLSSAEFHCKNHRYHPTNSIRIIHGALQYIKETI